MLGQKKDKGKSSGDKSKVPRKKVMEYYEYIRNKEEDEAKVRRDEILSGLPVIADIEKSIRDNFTEITKLAISGTVDKQQRIAELNNKNMALQKEKQRNLTANGIPVDYMEVHYKCPLCKDTGTTENGMVCSCYVTRAEEASQWER